MSKTHDRRQIRRAPVPASLQRVSEAAALTSTSPSTIYKWIREGKVSAGRHGDMLYISVAEVRRHKKRQAHSTSTVPAPPPAGLRTVRYASAETGVPPTTIQRWARNGRIRATRRGPKIWYVSLGDVRRLSQTLKPGPKPKRPPKGAGRGMAKLGRS